LVVFDFGRAFFGFAAFAAGRFAGFFDDDLATVSTPYDTIAPAALPQFVMAGLVPAIHAFVCGARRRRGCPAQGRA
jgi:hypothetical protein